ncbi:MULTISPECIES: hypothetical protein [Methylobacterium]|uniref:hypothetical protein n=1 Tax=Methylobacterium TaxID=407 RepID=UPI0013ED17E6|nr:hypothetical protein [Methylobacterium sp. DB0501]NGM37672.1 hypothetical protein [Methylobacterium sp. DB0501]
MPPLAVANPFVASGDSLFGARSGTNLRWTRLLDRDLAIPDGADPEEVAFTVTEAGDLLVLHGGTEIARFAVATLRNRLAGATPASSKERSP